MFIEGSRTVSQWFDIGGSGYKQNGIPESSLIDQLVYAALFISGCIILRNRRIEWKIFINKNIYIWLFFVIGAISIFWSDFPFVAFKRWIKALGILVLVLIILTEKRPYEAISLILRRLSFLFLPLSVLFVKYYPDLGREYHQYMGSQMFTGVATQKNALGALCLISGIYYSWNLIIEKKFLREENKLHFSIYIIILPMILWLLYISDSATSIICLIVAIGIFMIAKLNTIKCSPSRILSIFFFLVGFFIFLEFTFDFTDLIITAFGRSPDLTTRVPMWEDLLSKVKNPIIGFGYESFWLGERRIYMENTWGIKHQAHNGYLDMYLNMGIIGVLFIISWIGMGIKNISQHLTINFSAAVLRFSFIVVVAIYNWTEATFYGNNNMWLLFFFGVMNNVKSRENNMH